MSLVIVRNNGVKARNSNPSERDALTFGTEFYLIYIRKTKKKRKADNKIVYLVKIIYLTMLHSLIFLSICYINICLQIIPALIFISIWRNPP